MNNRCGKASSLSETMSSHFPVSVVRGKSERLGESHVGTRGDPGPKFRPWENLRDGNCHATSTGQKKWNDYLIFFMFVLLTVHRSIKIFPRSFYFSEYEILTARLSEYMKPVHDCVCNRPPKLPECVTIPPSLA